MRHSIGPVRGETGHPGVQGDSMNTTHQKHQKRPKKSVTRILAVSATLGLSLIHIDRAKVDHSRPLGGEGWGGGDCNAGLLSLLCL